jgi:outer membrane protein assembly factor BamB
MRRLSVLACVIAAVSCSAPSRPPISPSPPHGRLVQLDQADGTIQRDLAVGLDPLLAVSAGGGIWVLDLEDGKVHRVEEATGEIRTVDVGIAVGIASDGDSILVAADGDRLITLDGSTGNPTASIRIPGGPHFALRDAGFPVVVGGEVWITIPVGADQELWRVDLVTGRVRSKIAVGPDPTPPIFASGAIWFATSDDMIVRVDVGTEEVLHLDLGPFPFALAEGDGGVWVSTAGQIHLLDPVTGQRLRTLEVPGAARGLGWSGRSLWVTTSTSAVMVDPLDGTIEREVVLAPPSDDEGPFTVVPSGGSVWVTIEVT